jgi:hypothetical protein
MPSRSKPEHDSAAGVIPPRVAGMPWHVAEVAPLDGYRLSVRFNDGTTGEVDMSELVNSSRAGVFAHLIDPTLFSQVYIDYGAVAWPGGLDLAPDAMHTDIKKSGRCIVKGFAA